MQNSPTEESPVLVTDSATATGHADGTPAVDATVAPSPLVQLLGADAPAAGTCVDGVCSI